MICIFCIALGSVPFSTLDGELVHRYFIDHLAFHEFTVFAHVIVMLLLFAHLARRSKLIRVTKYFFWIELQFTLTLTVLCTLKNIHYHTFVTLSMKYFKWISLWFYDVFKWLHSVNIKDNKDIFLQKRYVHISQYNVW